MTDGLGRGSSLDLRLMIECLEPLLVHPWVLRWVKSASLVNFVALQNPITRCQLSLKPTRSSRQFRDKSRHRWKWLTLPQPASWHGQQIHIGGSTRLLSQRRRR